MSVADDYDFFALWDAHSRKADAPPASAPRVTPLRVVSGNHPYALAALRREAEAIAIMGPDSGRAVALNEAAFRMARHIGAGSIDKATVRDTLEDAARQARLPQHEIDHALRDTEGGGLIAGQASPREVPERDMPDLPPVTVLDPQQIDDFWTSRPELEHIRNFARARMCSPWAVLGVVLARVITVVPPFVTLPPLVGSEASLNLFVALVGPSGTGKGAAESAAADAFDLGHVEVAHVGSGEGIAHLYAHREKGEVVRDRDAVLFTVPEVDSLVALTGRQGATLLPQLRMAWSGERLGFAYVDRSKNLPIERHSYRLSLLLGVQPGRAAPLLEDSDGGTPQRFVWLPTTDPDAPDTAPDEPAPMSWSMPAIPWLAKNLRGLCVIDVPDVARNTVLQARRERLRGEGNALDGHALLSRLKVATAFALLAQRREMNDDDWKLSETVMKISDATRAEVQKHLSIKTRQTNMARGEAEAERAVFVAEKLDRAQVTRVCKVITRALRRGEGEWMSRRDVARTVASRDRAAVDDALGNLIDAGQVEAQPLSDKTLYRLSEKAS